MAGTRKQILNDLVKDLDTVEGVAKATEFFPSQDNVEKFAPTVVVVVEREEVVTSGTSRYKADLGLYVIADQSYTGIEDLIEDIKDYVKSASITNVLQLTYIGHEVVSKEDVDDNKFSSTKIDLELLYKDTNSDTLANADPTPALVGYMSISHYLVYAQIVSGSTTLQDAGTNVYDSHRNANLTIPANSGSLSVDIINSNVIPDQPGVSFSNICDYNEIQISVRGHFVEGTQNNVIMPFMYKVINEIRSNVELSGSYHVHTDEPFNIIYDQEFEESGTNGSELIFNVRKYWEYS